MTQHEGWIPYPERTNSQQLLSDAFRESRPTFGDVGGTVNLPPSALLYDLEKKATGNLLPRIWQQEGSCVGAAGARAYAQSICGDLVHRNTTEEVKAIFAWATWGIGRRIAGLNRRGGGSFGAAQAKAVREWGMLAADDPRLPQPTDKLGWLVWSSKIELDYSVPSRWPVDESVLAPSAGEHQMEYVARITTFDQLQQAFAQGYSVTCASMYGTKPRVKDGVLLGTWNDSWAHQMSWSGYYTHGTLGILVACDNQWGPAAHSDCPLLASMGVRGSFWIDEKTVRKLIADENAEIFAHGNSEDWPVRAIDWQSLGMGS